MDVMDAMRKRFSCRSWQDREVDDEMLERILAAGRIAPSARNGQPWRFVVVRDAETRAQLCVCAKGQKFVGRAPVVIAAVGANIDYVMTCGHPAFLIDVSIAVDHITLAAASLGLASCWVGAFHEQQAREVLGIPDCCRIVALLPIGYPDAEPPVRKSRKALSQITFDEKWRA